MGKRSRLKREFRAFRANYQERKPTRRSDLRWGIGWGLGFAICASLYMAVVRVRYGTGPFDRIGLNLAQVIACYLVVGIVSGSVLGLLRRYGAASTTRARLAGAVIGTVVYGSCGIVLFGVGLKAVGLGAAVGVPMGVLLAHRWRHDLIIVREDPLGTPDFQTAWMSRNQTRRESKRQ